MRITIEPASAQPGCSNVFIDGVKIGVSIYDPHVAEYVLKQLAYSGYDYNP